MWRERKQVEQIIKQIIYQSCLLTVQFTSTYSIITRTFFRVITFQSTAVIAISYTSDKMYERYPWCQLSLTTNTNANIYFAVNSLSLLTVSTFLRTKKQSETTKLKHSKYKLYHLSDGAMCVYTVQYDTNFSPPIRIPLWLPQSKHSIPQRDLVQSISTNIQNSFLLELDLTPGVQSFPHPGPNSKGVFIFSDMLRLEWTNQSALDGGGQLGQLYGCHYGWVHRISENRKISAKKIGAVRKTKT